MWARIENDTVVEVTTDDPVGRFHPSLKWVECDPDVKINWHYDGAQCLPPPSQPIDVLALRKRAEIDKARRQAFATGVSFDFSGEMDAVQIREEDKSNLLAIAMEARDLKAAGESNPVIDFRAASNTTYQLTPNQAIDMTNAALTHVKLIYEKSWQLKDAVDTAQQVGDREAIEAVTWS